MDPALKLCPRCGSHQVATDAIPHMGQQYNCPQCDYQGSFVIEADTMEDAKRIREELQADREEDDSPAGDAES